jgi:hypothetical protein
MRPTIRVLLWVGLAAAVAMPAGAQGARYQVHTMDFDIWCTEQERLPFERCDKRLPEDMQKFEAYREIVERYEIPYLQEKDRTLRFYEDIMRNDPVDKKPGNTMQKPPQPNDGH